MKTNLLNLRRKHNLSQKKLCEELKNFDCDMCRSAYTRYENGSRPLPCDVLIRLALYYGTTTDYILCLTDCEENKVNKKTDCKG